MDATGPDALEVALRSAIARHRAQLRREAERRTEAFEQRFLLACLGLVPAELDAIAAAASAAALPPELACRIESRLAAEAERLLRLARAGSARYDLNRHIAVHRGLDWLHGRPPRQDPAPGEDRQPGRAVNARFRRQRPPRRPPAGARPGPFAGAPGGRS
jgi:hypothetical protein